MIAKVRLDNKCQMKIHDRWDWGKGILVNIDCITIASRSQELVSVEFIQTTVCSYVAGRSKCWRLITKEETSTTARLH